MNKTMIKDFTHGNITKQLVIFALPLFLSNLLQIIYNMVDMIVVGKVLGVDGTAAVSVGGDISALMTFVAIGFANAGQVIIAQYIGAKEKHKISKFVGTMSGFLFVCAVVISILGITFQDVLLGLMNTPETAYAGAKDYSIICMSGLVFIYGYNIVSAILRGMGDSKHPFIFISFAAITNLILDIILVGFAGMGTAGAAIATVISQAVSFIACTVFLCIKHEQFELNIKLRDFIKWNGEMLSRLLKLGTPMAIKTASIQISKLFVNSYVNSYGATIAAFAGIVNKIASISNLISTALNTAGSTLVGQNLVAGKFNRVKKVMRDLAVITLTVSTLLSVLMCVFPKQIIGLFAKAGETGYDELIVGFLPIAVLLFFGSAARAIMNALLNGSGNYGVNFATAIFDGIIMRIGLAVLLGIVFGMKHWGFWLGDALAGFTPFFIGIVFYYSGAWKKCAKVTDDTTE